MVTKSNKDTLCIWQQPYYDSTYMVYLKREGKIISVWDGEIDATIEILTELKADIQADRERRRTHRRGDAEVNDPWLEVHRDA